MLAAKCMYFVNPRCEQVHVPNFVMLIYSIFQLCSGGPKMFSKIWSGGGLFSWLRRSFEIHSKNLLFKILPLLPASELPNLFHVRISLFQMLL